MLRIYLSNTDKFKHNPLYEMIVYAARRQGLAGATVLKGVMGFGSSSIVRSVKLWDITEKIPVVIEIIDEDEKIRAFLETILPWFEKLRSGCLIATEKVHVVLHKKGKTRQI